MALSNAVGVLASRLADGPFQLLSMHRSDRAEAAPEKPVAPGGAPVMAKSQTPVENQFWVDGVMR